MRRLLIAALAAALSATPAPATTIQPQSLPEMVERAEQVLQGRVISSRAVTEGSLIVTEYEIEVSDWLKPGPRGTARTITIIQPGGTLDGQTMVVVGAAHFAAGDEVVLFTRDYGGRGRQQVVNLSQGALPVADEPAPGPGRAPARKLAGASSFTDGAPRDLDAFKARVRELVAGGRR